MLPVAAGKTFEVKQRSGTPTVQMPANLRARTPEMRALAAAAQRGDIRHAIDLLGDKLVEAPGKMAEAAAEIWLALPAEERAGTILMASGRVHKALINETAQSRLLASGEFGSAALPLSVLEQVNATKEEMRYTARYSAGQIVEFNRYQKALDMPRGLHEVVRSDQHSGKVTLRGADGKERVFRPGSLRASRKDDSIRLYERKQITLREGDQIRWGDTDKQRGLDNKAIARVIGVGPGGITVETAAGIEVTLAADEPMLGKIDLAYALNIHMLQGATADRGIVVMDCSEKYLANERLFLVSVTRVRDGITVIADNAGTLVKKLATNKGDKGSALEITGGLDLPIPKPATTPVPSIADATPDRAPHPETAPQRADVDRLQLGAPVKVEPSKPLAGAVQPSKPEAAPTLQSARPTKSDGPSPDLDLDIGQGKPRQMDLDI